MSKLIKYGITLLFALAALVGCVGCGIKKEELTAAQLFIKGYTAEQEGNDKRAKYYWQKAAAKAPEEGSADAQSCLGLLYHSEHNFAKALEYYEQAADQGNSFAFLGLGDLYEYGDLYGIGQDYDKALEYYEKAAESDNEENRQSGLKRAAELREKIEGNVTEAHNEYEEYDEYKGGSPERKYILPTNTVFITKEDLSPYSKEEVSLIRNEIYARYGYNFQNEAIRNYFLSQSWYYPVEGVNANTLGPENMNKYERANLETIINYEKEMGWK